jgi:uncharacterized protein YecE (DUF72 family)
VEERFYSGVPRKWWLECYAERFNALEADGTLYHLLRESVANSWSRPRRPRQNRIRREVPRQEHRQRLVA